MNLLTKFAALAVVAGGASLGGQAQAATICFAFQDLETEFWVAGHKAITTTLTEAGHQVIERNANEDANRQLEQVRDCVAQGVDGIIIIPQDGDSATTIVREAQDADVPIAVFNRPPTDLSRGIVVVADNATIAEAATDFVVEQALENATEDRQLNALIIVGDLGDPNAVGRRDGFRAAIAKHEDRFNVIEVASNWDAGTALANLEAAVTANPQIDLMFTSSDFLFPTIRSVLEPRGMWKTAGEEGHIPLAGLDGDATACQLIKDGYVSATGVQDLYFEAESALTAILAAIEAGDTAPNEVIEDPGFALTQDNLAEREMDMWGCVLLADGFLNR
ncbi:sugar ABC transporter substrate-binding protein [Paracoccus tibetensis]|uniref:Monosaccharide ABC transporter substrate-binding protein, CUT2 family (TC 3.A.1.2.-) n=1 Tax=Paracoccus tibetensis TaxID=336292 RepID=A0A1G5HN95_9RHOB|nr:sugar ABC transporter substrate-binding protein [Paracoccus tibetensis]SCY65233.1 monosaccharide ABC transporter substrate-binding protein, CUT2 family (TC 3.A.1.2.-) [Paracoccus tibetensis]